MSLDCSKREVLNSQYNCDFIAENRKILIAINFVPFFDFIGDFFAILCYYIWAYSLEFVGNYSWGIKIWTFYSVRCNLQKPLRLTLLNFIISESKIIFVLEC
jgi:hypothetical protein